MTLPRFIVLKTLCDPTYLGYKHDNGNFNGYAEFTEPTVVSANAKFEVEFAKDGLVHIRSCTNNKYLERIHNLSITERPNEEYWITITADKPEEDRSKESCTLFKPIVEDFVNQNYRFVHVQSGYYLCLWSLDTSELGRGVLANHNHVAANRDDIFKVIDWETLVILPRYVAFKGNNNRFLRLTEVGGQPSLEFSSEDVGGHSVTMKVFYRKDGDIRIKPVCSDRFWRCSQNRIWVDSDETIVNDKDTHFRAFKVDSKTIALLNVGNDKFCKRYITRVTTDILAATDLSITKEAYLRVLEPVLSRTIYNLRYDTENARVYNEKVLVVAQNSATNRTTQANTLDVKLSYSETNTSTWLARFTLDLETKATFQVGVPFIGETGVEISSKYETGIEWGKTKTMTTDMEVTHQVRVPPMTKVTVYLKMTNGTCDVPFVFTQKDSLYNGFFVTTDVLGNTFTGTNYYNIQYDSKEEPLTSEPLTSEPLTSEPPTSGNQNINVYCEII
ncbi:uncharacterized protein LOC105795568 [Gossypium raimondii]|uniref:Agglutinin domain-containing protein n=1 Tax=Gossypium raimondii TaxID=29730 RepID=A0A0D2S9C5_GOSRA|nr:uncharacterized protein LOC105795568 [Gossypium raimondii]KJB27825.1 hypothetical protein B456_005G012000 [Gossypium raimondii]